MPPCIPRESSSRSRIAACMFEGPETTPTNTFVPPFVHVLTVLFVVQQDTKQRAAAEFEAQWKLLATRGPGADRDATLSAAAANLRATICAFSLYETPFDGDHYLNGDFLDFVPHESTRLWYNFCRDPINALLGESTEGSPYHAVLLTKDFFDAAEKALERVTDPLVRTAVELHIDIAREMRGVFSSMWCVFAFL